MENIKMVDLQGQYLRLKPEIDEAIQQVLNSTAFIQGPQVQSFAKALAEYNEIDHVIPCGNGTDALQIALMALDLKPGDEVILPVFTYVATAEVIALLNLKPVFVDVNPDDFNIEIRELEKVITGQTKAIVPVHLFGQCAPMESLLDLAKKYNLFIVEDAAQALGAEYTFSNGKKMKAGTMGNIGCTSFFPSKNLGAFGDGGALFCRDEALATKIKKIANHGQGKKYYHEIIGVNSRLDTLQAAILEVKLKHLNDFTKRRQAVASFYDKALGSLEYLRIPERNTWSTHVFHQYTLQIEKDRDEFQQHLLRHQIPSMVYYPIPLHWQEAYRSWNGDHRSFPVAESLSKSVISLPIHTELEEGQLEKIVSAIKKHFH